MRVEQMTGSTGKPVANQFIVYTDKGTYFQSYDSVIALIKPDGSIELGSDWDYSVTTSKYRNKFLGMNKQELQAKIDSGEIVINESL